MSKTSVNTGAVGYVELDRPRPGPAAKGKGAVAVRPGPVAYYAGETEADARAFAAVVNRSYSALVKREKARRALPVEDPREVVAREWQAAQTSGITNGAHETLRRYPTAEAAFAALQVNSGPVHWPAHDPKLDELVAELNAKRGVVAPVVVHKGQKAPRKAAAPVMAPKVVARDGGTLLCARCGRSDFRTPKGRDWHLGNNPDCAKYRKPDRHAYATL